MKVNLLVTGGASYIGSHACKALKESGYIPITFDNLSTIKTVQYSKKVHRGFGKYNWLHRSDVGCQSSKGVSFKDLEVVNDLHEFNSDHVLL